jgi:hypothetical protein
MRRRGVSRDGKVGPGAGLGDFTIKSPLVVETILSRVPLRNVAAGVRLLVQFAADVLGRLRVDQGLQDRVQQLSHQLTTIGAAKRLGQLEQGRLVQGHRVKSFREFLGRYSQSLMRWLLNARDRHGHPAEEPDLHHPSQDSPAANEPWAELLPPLRNLVAAITGADVEVDTMAINAFRP